MIDAGDLIKKEDEEGPDRPHPEPCLICSSLKTGPQNSSIQGYPHPKNSKESSSPSINSSLWSLFVLKELLLYPKEKCEEILRTTGLDPGQWFAVCSSCSELVRYAINLHQKILELEEQLKRAREQVSSKMRLSFIYQDEGIREEFGVDVFCTRRGIREFYRPHLVPPKEEIINLGSLDCEETTLVTGDLDAVRGCDNLSEWGSDKADAAGSDDDDKDDPTFSPEMRADSPPPGVDEANLGRRKPRKAPRKSTKRKGSHRGKYKPRLKGEKNMFKCLSCPAAFSKQSLQKLHTFLRHTFDDIPPLENSKEDTNESLENGGFACILCSSRYSKMYRLVEHLEDHDRLRSTTCEICKYPAESQKSLDRHHRSRHMESSTIAGKDKSGNYYFKCVKCDFECTHPRHKFRHVEGHKFNDNLSVNSATEFQCKLCNHLSKTKPLAKVHIREKHWKEVNLNAGAVCPTCGKVFHDSSKLKEHVEIVHEGKFRFYCEECGEGFRRPIELALHKPTHRGEGEVICDICGNSYSNIRSLNGHKRYSHGNRVRSSSSTFKRRARDVNEELTEVTSPQVPKIVMCVHCHRPVRNLAQHMKKEHSELYMHKCDLCGKNFQKMGFLMMHKRTVHAATGDDGKPKERRLIGEYFFERGERDFGCKICDISLPSRKQIRKHLLEEHTNELVGVRLVRCPICGEAYAGGTSQMKDHLQSVHKKIRRFRCEQCGKGYMRVGEFKQHKLMHLNNGERCIICDLCGKGYSTATSLHVHKWKCHRGESNTKQAQRASASVESDSKLERSADAV